MLLACIFISYETSFAMSGGKSKGMMKKAGGGGDAQKAGKAMGLSKLSQNSSGGSGGSGSTPPTPPTPPSGTPPIPSTPTTPGGLTSPTTPPATTAPATPPSTTDKPVVDASPEETITAEQHQANVQNDNSIMQKLTAINEQDISNRRAIEDLSYNLLFNNYNNLKNFIITNFTKAKFLALCQELVNQIYPEDNDNTINFGTPIVETEPAQVTSKTDATPADDATPASTDDATPAATDDAAAAPADDTTPTDEATPTDDAVPADDAAASE